MHWVEGKDAVTQLIADPVAPSVPTEAGPGAGTGGTDGAGAAPAAPEADAHAALPLVALVLGISGVVLGVTVIWFFAAIPVGIVSVVTGLFARRHVEQYHDSARPTAPRSAPRSAASRSSSA